MIKIEFDFNLEITIIQADLNESFKDIFDKYLQKTKIKSETVYFSANADALKLEEHQKIKWIKRIKKKIP